LLTAGTAFVQLTIFACLEILSDKKTLFSRTEVCCWFLAISQESSTTTGQVCRYNLVQFAGQRVTIECINCSAAFNGVHHFSEDVAQLQRFLGSSSMSNSV
jgi:hypothetical protein